MLTRIVQRHSDLPALDELFRTIHECDGHAPIGEHKYLHLLGGSPETGGGLVAERDGKLLGYVAVGRTQEQGVWAMELAIHPLHRDDATLQAAVTAGVARAGAEGAEVMRCWAFHPKLVAALEHSGFEPERELRQLRVDLPLAHAAELPPGVRIAPFRVGVDEATWLKVNNAAFAGHPENGSWTEEVLADRKSQPWFDPAGFLMAWENAELVAFCWTKVHDDGVGEIYVIGVAPAHQGRGLGRAMVVKGLSFLNGDRGVTRAMLYADAENTAALALYHDLGFRLDHVDRSLVRKL